MRNNKSVAGVLRQLGLKLCGGSHAVVKLRMKQLKLDQSHFTGQGWCSGDKHKEFTKKVNTYSLEEILVEESTYQNTCHLKKRLIQEGLLKEECYECGLGPEWNAKSLSLQLDHIDGDRCNNLLDNLRILCPNCHSQTETYCAKKAG